jgi:hypothetical protein
MILRLCKILPAAVPLLVMSPSASAGVLPVGQVEYEFVYDRLERMDVLSADSYDYQLGPYRFDNELLHFGPFEDYRRILPGSLVMFSFLAEDFRASKRARADAYESLRSGIAGRPLDKVFVYGKFVLDEEMAEDENYTGKKWRGLAGGVEEAFVNYRSGPFDLTVGRFGSFWGLRNSLVLSYNEPLDGFGYSYRWGKLTISYRLARLDGFSPNGDDIELFENRYFAGHRLDFHFTKRLRIGLFETVVFGGPGRQIDLFYLNPLIFFHGSQLNEGIDDNIIVGLDFSFKPGTGIKLYGQLLVDDYQIEDKSRSDREPNEIGYIVGAYWADLAPELDATIEYNRVNNWTFNQALDRNRYLFRDQPIGGALGNDYDLVTLSLIKWFGDNLAMQADVGRIRQGEGSITAAWTAPWLAASGDYYESFPSGVVEKTTTAGTALKGFFFDSFFLSAETGVRWVSNYHNRQGDNRTLPFFNLILSAFVSQKLDLE